MKLDTEFYKLPLKFDVDLLQKEIAQFSEEDWQPHPQGFAGNSALLLVAVNGDSTNNDLKGEMKPTPLLERCPYLKQVLASFGTVIGRTRLMRLGGEAEVTAHTDANYYWQQRVRIHVPIITYPEIKFICGEESIHMGEGETWLFDTSKIHNVINPTPHTRIHLVCDTVGTAFFWDLVDKAYQPFGYQENEHTEACFILFKSDEQPNLITEKINLPIVMSPWEQEHFLSIFWEDFWEMEHENIAQVEQLEKITKELQREWLGLWAQYGMNKAGFPFYEKTILKFNQQLHQLDNKALRLNNGIGAVTTLNQLLILPALNFDLAPKDTVKVFPTTQKKEDKSPQITTKNSPSQGKPEFDRPIFIVAAPRSGSSFLFETLMRSPSVVTIGNESHGIFERIPQLHPANRNFDSNRLTEADVTPEIAQTLKQSFLSKLQDSQGNKLSSTISSFRMLEKTPKNALRIPFINAIFPDALFIYLYREPNENISSMIEAWKSNRFVTYGKLPQWNGKPWSLLLIPEWQKLKQKSLGKIAATQWQVSHQYILDDLAKIEPHRCYGVNYKDLVKDTQKEIEKLCKFANIQWNQDISKEKLPLSRYTVTPPNPQKWKKNASAIKPFLSKMQPTVKRAKKAIQNFATIAKNTKSQISPPPIVKDDFIPPQEKKHISPSPIANKTTDKFANILKQINTSVVISSPQTNQLIVIGSSKDKLKTQYREFSQPTALTGDFSRLSIVTPYQVSYFRNMSAVAAKLEPIGEYDACFLHRKSHVTGELKIQDIIYCKDKLWFISSRFSCLCTYDLPHSFTPIWQPPFIQTLTPDDVCHLNGLAIVDEQPKYVTALSETNYKQGWKQTLARGGVIIDIESNEIIVRGISIPNSPRWYQGKLWVLESGTGNLSQVDLNKGKLEPLVKLPGFARGLNFIGDYALIGISPLHQYTNLPINDENFEAIAGVCIVNLKTGKIETQVTFENIPKIFAVQTLSNIRLPDITNFDEPLTKKSYALSDEALKDVPGAIR